MNPFHYRTLTGNTLFGTGRFDDFLQELSAYHRIVLIGSPRVADYAEVLRARFTVEWFQEVIQHVPQPLVDKAADVVEAFKPDLLLAIGGGSAIGLAKALALKTSLPIAAVPTTFSGSEQTNIWGISNENGKTTGKDERVYPRYVLYDSDVTVGMPQSLAVKSSMNAMAHLMEAVYAPDGNPLTRELALLGIRELKKGLARISTTDVHMDKEAERAVHELLLFGAYLAGKCLGEVSMSLHHKTAHVLGGSFGLDHASVHTVLQSYVLEYQWPHLAEAVRRDFIDALGDNPAQTLRDLARIGGAAVTLGDIGFRREDIPRAVEIILSKPYANVAPLESGRLTDMLEAAFSGQV